jgi:2-dehydro-3-deoxyphosphogluconate aldolase / (4S)-4-hydroxy-2-oxoglutarate aldolase
VLGVQIERVVQRIGEVGIIPVVRATSAEEASSAIEAICAGGIPIVEVTMTVPDAVSLIGKVARQLGGTVMIGAGTVTSSKQAEACIDAGAKFIVSPGLSIDVLAAARDGGTLAIPGTLTPTELMAALENGAKLVKVFPCGNVGGPKYLKSLRGPFPEAALIPTGGVNAVNAGEFISAGAFAIGVGADLVDLAALRAGHPEKITQSAQQLVQAVARAREVKAALS